MNKYKKLAVNTAIFGIGSFGAKIFSLLLNNLYTKHISPSDLYTKSLLETLIVLLLPVFTFSLTEAIVRYGLDKRYKKKEIFSTAAIIMFVGLAAMLPFVPLLHFIPILRPITGYAMPSCTRYAVVRSNTTISRSGTAIPRIRYVDFISQPQV